MAVSIDREIAQLRNTPGQNWNARALQKLQDAINGIGSGGSGTIVAAPASPSIPKGLFNELTLPAPSPVIPPPPSGPGVIIVNSQNVPVGSGNKIIALSISSTISAIIAILSPVTTVLTQMISLTVPTQGGYVKIFTSGQLYNTGATGQPFQIQVWKGTNTGTKLFDTGINGPYVPSGTLGVSWSIAPRVDPSPAASQQYTIYAAISAGTGQMDNIEIVAENSIA